MTDKRRRPESTAWLAGSILIVLASAAVAAPPAPRERGSVDMAEEGPAIGSLNNVFVFGEIALDEI